MTLSDEAPDGAAGVVKTPGTIAGYTVTLAACSIVYELVYSQALTVVHGQTVARYSLTIGLFLMSLGIGAFLFSRTRWSNIVGSFYLVELTLALVGPAGVFLILWMPDSGTITLLLSHLPVIVVGVLSGIELPMLATLASPHRRSVFDVLGWDYVGSLAGTVLYGLWLYPSHGLVAAAIGTGVVNALAAVSFLTLFGNRRTGAILANLAVTAACALLLFNLSAIQDQVSRWYAARQVAARFESMSQHLKRLDMKHVEQTRYQEIWRYDLHWDWGTERCLELDGQLQTCESWAADYHHGLVDVPVTLFEAERPLEVLVVGGGDFIPMAFLAEHKNVARVDQVDIDPQFMEFAKRSELLAKFHKHSYRDPRLNLVVADAMSFVRHSKSSYDLVLLDLPGLMHDKLLPLYSQEFFGAVRRRLKPDGVVVTWVYPESSRPKHAQILRQTFLAAGFGRLARYRAYGEPDGHEQAAQFALLTVDAAPKVEFGRVAYVDRWRARHEAIEWKPLEVSTLFRPNSVLKPNLGMLIRR